MFLMRNPAPGRAHKGPIWGAASLLASEVLLWGLLVLLMAGHEREPLVLTE